MVVPVVLWRYVQTAIGVWSKMNHKILMASRLYILRHVLELKCNIQDLIYTL